MFVKVGKLPLRFQSSAERYMQAVRLTFQLWTSLASDKANRGKIRGSLCDYNMREASKQKDSTSVL